MELGQRIEQNSRPLEALYPAVGPNANLARVGNNPSIGGGNVGHAAHLHAVLGQVIYPRDGVKLQAHLVGIGGVEVRLGGISVGGHAQLHLLFLKVPMPPTQCGFELGIGQVDAGFAALFTRKIGVALLQVVIEHYVVSREGGLVRFGRLDAQRGFAPRVAVRLKGERRRLDKRLRPIEAAVATRILGRQQRCAFESIGHRSALGFGVGGGGRVKTNGLAGARRAEVHRILAHVPVHEVARRQVHVGNIDTFGFFGRDDPRFAYAHHRVAVKHEFVGRERARLVRNGAVGLQALAIHLHLIEHPAAALIQRKTVLGHVVHEAQRTIGLHGKLGFDVGDDAPAAKRTIKPRSRLADAIKRIELKRRNVEYQGRVVGPAQHFLLAKIYVGPALRIERWILALFLASRLVQWVVEEKATGRNLAFVGEGKVGVLGFALARLLGFAADNDGVNLGHINVEAVVIELEIAPLEAHGRGHHRAAKIDVAVFLNADNCAVRLHEYSGRVVGKIEAFHAAHQQLIGIQVESGVAARARQRLDGDVVVIFFVAGGGYVMRSFGQNGHLAGLGVPLHVAIAGKAGHGTAHIKLRRLQIGRQITHINDFYIVVALGIAYQHL